MFRKFENFMSNEFIDLKKICLVPGVSGNEIYSGVSQEIFSIVENINKNTIIDKYGNVISFLGKGKKRILIDSHLDEIGFLVSKKNYDKIELISIGDSNISKINNSKAYILKKNIIGKVIQQDKNIIFQTDNFYCNKNINVGDIVSFSRSFKIKNNLIEATALDNRIGCACLIYLMKKIIKKNINDLELIFTFTAGEERDSSILDKIATKYDVNFGIIVDAAYAEPVSFETNNMSIPKLGKGCALQYLGKNFVVDKNIISKIEQLAKKENILIQKEIPIPNLGRTNFSKFQQTGILGCVINIPVRDQHEQISKTNVDDFYSAAKLILSIVKTFK